MIKRDILGKAIARGKANGKNWDRDYLLAEMQKIADDLGTLLSGYSEADQAVLIFILRATLRNMENTSLPPVLEVAGGLETVFGAAVVSVRKGVPENEL